MFKIPLDFLSKVMSSSFGWTELEVGQKALLEVSNRRFGNRSMNWFKVMRKMAART